MEGRPAAQLTPAVPERRSGALAAVGAVVARPRLWPAAARQARAMVPSGWWRRRPFLPLPDRAWLRFRMTTAYGDPGAPIDVEDLLAWLAWTDTVEVDAETPRPPSTRSAGVAAVGHRARPAPPSGGPDRS